MVGKRAAQGEREGEEREEERGQGKAGGGGKEEHSSAMAAQAQKPLPTTLLRTLSDLPQSHPSFQPPSPLPHSYPQIPMWLPTLQLMDRACPLDGAAETEGRTPHTWAVRAQHPEPEVQLPGTS